MLSDLVDVLDFRDEPPTAPLAQRKPSARGMFCVRCLMLFSSEISLARWR
jgi:hypothetical protein